MFKKLILPSVLLLATGAAQASLVSALDTPFWTVFANDDGGAKGAAGYYDSTGNEIQTGDPKYGYNSDGEGTKAHGGQKYDTEYLLYNITGNTLSLALQTGFDLVNNNGANHYWSGDLALSFDGNSGYGYEYAIDFGAKGTYDKNGDRVFSSDEFISAHTAGLYDVTEWTDKVYEYNINGPSNMLSGNFISGVNLVTAQETYIEDGLSVVSYYNTMSFDLSALGLTADDVKNLDAYWTMSCGNDVIHGKVPEPSALLLLSTGILGLAGFGIRRKRKFS